MTGRKGTRWDWFEAIWAEARVVPPGLARLAWRAGGIWVLTREILRPRRVVKAALFAAAAAAAGFGGLHGVSSGGAPWPGEIVIVLIIAGYVAAFLFLTSRRAGAWRSTLAIGAGAGLLFGLVMYAVAPLGLGLDATNPWLPGSDVDPLVALAWLLLVGGPAAAAVLAARSGRGADGLVPPAGTRIRQGIAAGVLANLTGALFVTALGTGTTALMLGSASVRQWVYHGQHLSALALYHQEQNASVSTEVYVVMCIAFPVIGLLTSALAAAIANPPPSQPVPTAL